MELDVIGLERVVPPVVLVAQYFVGCSCNVSYNWIHSGCWSIRGDNAAKVCGPDCQRSCFCEAIGVTTYHLCPYEAWPVAVSSCNFSMVKHIHM